MLDSVVVARDKFMRPGGAMYPSHANMYLVPIRTESAYNKNHDFHVSARERRGAPPPPPASALVCVWGEGGGGGRGGRRPHRRVRAVLAVLLASAQNSMEGWSEFLQEMQSFYQVRRARESGATCLGRAPWQRAAALPSLAAPSQPWQRAALAAPWQPWQRAAAPEPRSLHLPRRSRRQRVGPGRRDGRRVVAAVGAAGCGEARPAGGGGASR